MPQQNEYNKLLEMYYQIGTFDNMKFQDFQINESKIVKSKKQIKKEKLNDLETIKATLLINFSDSKNKRDRKSDLPNLLSGNEESVYMMLMKVLEYYIPSK